MKRKKLHLALLAIAISVCNISSAQLFIDQATFTIQSGATVTVQGDVTSNVDIQGAGKIVLKGTANQNVNVGGFTIPNLEVDNTSNVTLTGNAKIGTSLLFTNGKIFLGNNNLTLADVATTSGAGTSKFVETNGTGQLIKTLTANVTSTELPVGAGTSYRPAFVTSVATAYSSANVGVKVIGAAAPNRPAKLNDYVAAYWPVTKTGITGTVTVAGQYIDGTDVTGTEANLKGYFFNGTDWISTGETHDATLNRVAAPIATASGTVYGMDKFILVKTKAFLQGAFSLTANPPMSDVLRTSNLIPTTDPYRSAPYSSAFVQKNNPLAEVATTAALANHVTTDSNVVDWVFLELRVNKVSQGDSVAQTRSALITRVGNIVDVDGVSPVTFNNVANGNYTIAVRHRNHLGISSDPVANLYAATEQKSATPQQDLTTATDAQIFGTTSAYTVLTNTVLGARNVMWGGNANFNTNVKFINLGNDKDYILTSSSSAPLYLGLGNNIAAPLLNVYSPSDLNMNGSVKYINLGNDKDFLFTNVLGNVTNTTRTQQLPN